MKAHLHSAKPKLKIGVFRLPQSRPWSQGGGRLSVTFRAPWGISGCALARADVNWRRVDVSEQRSEYVWKYTCLVRETGPASKKTQPEECRWTGRPVAHAGWTNSSDVTRRGGRRDAELWRKLRRGTWWSCRVPHHRRATQRGGQGVIAGPDPPFPGVTTIIGAGRFLWRDSVEDVRPKVHTE